MKTWLGIFLISLVLLFGFGCQNTQHSGYMNESAKKLHSAFASFYTFGALGPSKISREHVTLLASYGAPVSTLFMHVLCQLRPFKIIDMKRRRVGNMQLLAHFCPQKVPIPSGNQRPAITGS